MVTIVEVDPHDDRLLQAFWENEQVAHRADRSHPVLRTYGALAATVRLPPAYYGNLLLAAIEDRELVGGVHASYPIRDNLHLGEVEVTVAPGHRRVGVGTLLHEAALARLGELGRSTVIGEATAAPDGSGPALPFAASVGYDSAHVEEHLVLELPAAGVDEPASPAYDVVTWADRCPDELLAAYCAMRTQMAADVPMGDLEIEPTVWDAERVRTSEERLASAYHELVSAAVQGDGTMAGYSVMYLAHGETHVQQDDTLVMPEHRGHRLGLRLKQANLEALARAHPDRRAVHTWTAPDNSAMRRTNERVGFRVVEMLHEMQRKI